MSPPRRLARPPGATPATPSPDVPTRHPACPVGATLATRPSRPLPSPPDPGTSNPPARHPHATPHTPHSPLPYHPASPRNATPWSTPRDHQPLHALIHTTHPPSTARQGASPYLLPGYPPAGTHPVPPFSRSRPLNTSAKPRVQVRLLVAKPHDCVAFKFLLGGSRVLVRWTWFPSVDVKTARLRGVQVRPSFHELGFRPITGLTGEIARQRGVQVSGFLVLCIATNDSGGVQVSDPYAVFRFSAIALWCRSS